MMKKILFFDINPSPMIEKGIMPAFEKLGYVAAMPANRLQFDNLKYPNCMTSHLTRQEKYDIVYKSIQETDADTVFLNGANLYYDAVSNACKAFNKYFIYWATEDPVLYNLMLPITARHADLVLSPAIECVEEYRKMGLNAHLMMFGCNPDYHKTGSHNPKYDFDIVLQASYYNHPARIKGYDIILQPAIRLYEEHYRVGVWGAFWNTPFGMKYMKHHELYHGFHPNEDISDICASTKIILGIQCSDCSVTQQSMRSFEVLSCGGFHLTQHVKSMDYWFENGKHLVSVKDKEEAYEKMKYYLKHDEERKKIALQGYEYVRNNHTYIHRIREAVLPNL